MSLVALNINDEYDDNGLGPSHTEPLRSAAIDKCKGDMWGFTHSHATEWKHSDGDGGCFQHRSQRLKVALLMTIDRVKL